MVSTIFSFLRTFWLLIAYLGIYAAEPAADIAFSKELRFLVSAEKNSYRLSSSVSIRQKALQPQGTRHFDLQIPEESCTQISQLTGRFRGVELPDSAINFHYPHSQSTFTPPSKVYQITPPTEAKPGDELVCDYNVSYEDPTYFPIVQVPALNRVDRFAVIITHPADVSVDFEIYSPAADVQPKIERTPKETQIVFQNLPAPALLSENPFAGSHALVLVKLKTGDRMLTAHTPVAFCRWYRAQVEAMGKLSDAMKQLLTAELASASSPRDKAKILFDYVKTNIRYIADHGEGHAFIPHAPAEIFEKKWGDCKDKAWLLSLLAAEHGLSIHPVLLSTDFAPEFSDLNLGLFDHVICAMEDQGQMIFMDPTASYSELGDPPDADLLAKGFVLDPNNPRWLQISDTRTTAPVELLLNASLDDLKHGKAKVLLRHDWRSSAKKAQKEMKKLALENLLSNGLNRILSKISLDHFVFQADDSGTLSLTADADLSEFVITTDLRLYLPTAPFRGLSRDLLDRTKDTLPIDTKGPDHYRMQIQLQCSGLQLKPDAVRLGSPDKAQFQASLAVGDGLLTLDYSYRQPFHFVPMAEREGLLTFCSQYLQLNRKPFYLQRISQ